MSQWNCNKSMNAEEIITVERKEDLATIRTPKVFYPKSKYYFVSFQDKDDFDEKDEDLTESEENNKIKMRSYDIQKIMKMAGVPHRKLSTYILYLLTLVETEYIQNIPNDKKEYKIDYKMMTKIIKHFYVLVNKDQEDDDGIKISRDSLLKIFDLLRLSIKDRLKLMEFYEVETDEISNENIREREIFKSPLNQIDKSRPSNNPRDKFRTPKPKDKNGTKPLSYKRDLPTKSPGKTNKVISISREKVERYRSSLEPPSHEDGKKRLRKKGKKNDKMFPENEIDEELKGEEEEEFEGEDDFKKNTPMGKGGKNRNRGRGNNADVGLGKGNKQNRNDGKKKPNDINEDENEDDFNDNLPRGKGKKGNRGKPSKYEEEEDELDDNVPKDKRKGKKNPDDYDIDDDINLRKGIRGKPGRNNYDDEDLNEDDDNFPRGKKGRKDKYDDENDDNRGPRERGKDNRGRRRNNYGDDDKDNDDYQNNAPNRDRRGKPNDRRDYYDNDSEGDYKRNQPRGRDRDGRRGYDDYNDNRDDYDNNNMPRGSQNRGRPNQYRNEDNDYYPRGREQDGFRGRPNNYENDDYRNSYPRREGPGKRSNYEDGEKEGDYNNIPNDMGRNRGKPNNLYGPNYNGEDNNGLPDNRNRFDKNNYGDNMNEQGNFPGQRGIDQNRGKPNNLYGPNYNDNKGRPNYYDNEDMNSKEGDYDNNYPRGRGQDENRGRPNNFDDNKNNDYNNNNLPRGGRKYDTRDKNNILGNDMIKEPADENNKFSPKGKTNDNKRPSNVSNEKVDEFDQVLSDNLPRGASKLKNSQHKSNAGENNLDNPQLEDRKNLNKPDDNEDNSNLPKGKGKDRNKPNTFGDEDDKNNNSPGKKGKGNKNNNTNEFNEENPNGEEDNMPKFRNRKNVEPEGEDDGEDLENNKKPLKSPAKLSKYKSTYEKLKEKITKSIASNDLDDDDDDLNKKDNDNADEPDNKSKPGDKKDKKGKGPKNKNRPNDDDNLDDNGSEGVPELSKGNKKRGNKPPSKKGKSEDLDNNDNQDNDNPESSKGAGDEGDDAKPKTPFNNDKDKDSNDDSNDEGSGDNKKPKKTPGKTRSKPSFADDEEEINMKKVITKSKEKLLKRINNYENDEPNDDGTERESKGNKRTKSKNSLNTDELNDDDDNKPENPLDKEEPSKSKPKKKLIKKKIPKKKIPVSGEDDKPKGKKPRDRKGKSRDRKLKPEQNDTDKSPLASETDHYKYEAEDIEIEITEEILHKIPENKKHDVPESASEIEVGSESFVVPYVDPREHHKRKKSETGVGTGPMEPMNLRDLKKPKGKHRPSHHFRGSIDANTCLYHFIHRKKREYGNWPMYLVGNLPQLGNDNIKNAIKMDEEERNGQKFYSKYVPVKDDKFPFHYRYFFNKNGQIEWLTAPDTFIAHKQFFTLLQNMRNNVISIFDLNIRYLNDVDGLNVWDLRKDQLIQVILNAGPDVIYFQEITKIQFEFIDDNLGSVYDFVGMYRDSTDRSEKCSISYNKFKYTLNDWGQFWLSSTPSVPGSNDFCNFFPRICTWCSLKQLEGLDFLFFNIHLDHVTFEAHMPCIVVALEQMNEVLSKFPETQAIFFGGCFYCEEDDPIIDKVKSHGFILVPIENTFHDFAGDADRHWDYLFWKPYTKIGDTTYRFVHSVVDKPGSTINRAKQQFISDHYPYYAEFEIKGTKFDNQSDPSEPSNQSNNQSEED